MRNSFWLRLGAAVVFVSLAVASINMPLKAQQPGPAPAQSNPLNLTAAQKTAIGALQKTAQTKYTALQTNTKLTPTQKSEQLQALNTWFRDQSLAVLTPSQRAIALAHQKAMMAQNAAKQALIAPKIAQLKALAAKLKASLSPKQKTDISTLEAAQTAQTRALLSDKTLTMQQKQSQYQVIQQGNLTKFNAIMTPAQLQMLNQLNAMQSDIRQIAGGPQGQP